MFFNMSESETTETKKPEYVSASDAAYVVALIVCGFFLSAFAAGIWIRMVLFVSGLH
jgi:hypothetical protein